MSKRAEELSAAYTDARLELLRPDIAADNYTRGRKMSLDIFDGNEVESAYEAGYEQAEKDTIERVCDWLEEHLPIIVNYYDEDIHEDAYRAEFIDLFRKQIKKE